MKVSIHTVDGSVNAYDYCEDLIYTKDGVTVVLNLRGDTEWFPFVNIIKVVRQ